MIREDGRADDRAPLIFIPGLGGEDEHTRRLVRLLECAFAVSVFRMPDIETPCPQIYRIADLSNQIAEQARATARSGDAIIAGYSIGGVLAYEAACRLIEAGRSPACVALFDTSPRLVDSKPFYFLREAIRASRARPMGGVSSLLVLLFAAFGQLGALRRLVRRGLARRHPGRAEAMRKKLLLYLWRKSISQYDLKPSSTRVILFVAETARPGVVERTLGWHNYAHHLDVVELRGNHWTMLHLDELGHNSARILKGLQAARLNL